jgi:non-lysosomal glucosylceramidase
MYTLPSPAAPLRTFTGESLRKVAFPLGGIGTGTVSLGGRGNLRDWEIFNHPGKGCNLPYTFFAIWVKPEGEAPIARILERRLLPPYDSAQGLPPGFLCGLPRLREARFTGGYPLAWIEFEDETLPVTARLDAFNPFLPMNEKDSGIPAAVFLWTIHNPGAKRVEATLAYSQLNACGYDGRASGLSQRYHSQFGQNLNTFVQEEGLSGIRMSTAQYAPDHPQFGTMAIATDALDVTWLTRWERSGWWDDAQNFWDDFSSDGLLSNGPETTPSPQNQTDVGTLGARIALAPGETTQIPFLLAWHFPNLINEWNGEPAVKGKRIGNWYATQWTDAWSALRYLHANLQRLREETLSFFHTFFETTLPEPVLDAVSANASIVRTTTCLRTEDGRFNAFEGCGSNMGCCPMNCTHVWNYAASVAYLFPALERSVRLTDFQHNTRPNGSMAFRTLLPLIGELWQFKPAADGQMGTIIRAYREWLQCGDRAFLESIWQGVVRALEYAWSPGGWDPDRDGVMEGEQHNTYDIEFYGPNTLCGLLYLGALRAAEEMAIAMGDHARAQEYHAVFESGSRKYAETLWNGEYFVQTVIPPAKAQAQEGVAAGLPGSIQGAEADPRYQYGPGCLSDQMLGQWMARLVGLGDLVPKEKVKSALAAIVRHNFKRDLSDHHSVQRVYALNDEAGLLLCSWPNGGRPRYPFPYADEVWTGIEYHVAAHCIYEGLLAEGLEIVKAARDRHDGARRNPWDEFECGHHYARAMSSWSLLLALTGCHYHAAAQHLAFAPKMNADDFRCFFSAGDVWGQFAQKRDGVRYTATLEPRRGELTLKTLSLPLPVAVSVSATLDGQPVQASLSGGAISFDDPVTLRAGQTLEVSA